MTTANPTIIRRVHNVNFTIIGNKCLQDETLSAEALGVLCYLLGKPNDWQVMIADLTRRFGCGKDRMQRIMRELIEARYVHREQDRDARSNTFGSVRYVVYSDPDEPQPENTVAEPQPEKPQPGKPRAENPPLLNTESNKELRLSSREGPDDGWPVDYLDQFWKEFPPYRREGRRKVGEKLARLRRDKAVAWAALIEAVRKYAATNPGEYACAPIVWLNGERWDRVYGQGGPNGERRDGPSRSGAGFAALRARIHRDRGGGGPPTPAQPAG